ncbi:MAG TPA: sugar ABC transporter permease [Streptosporangiaceae bacterium]|nr:sugar ABC transporter permease [Streptosporangiaceae bacterium]
MTTMSRTERSAVGGHARRRRRRRVWVSITLFLLPALVLFVFLVLAPILIAAYASFFKWNGLGGPPTDYVGLGNFRRLFDDEVFHKDLWHGVVLVVLSLVVQLPLALGIALLLNQRFRGRAFFRVVFFAPYVLSEVITGVLFTILFSPETGVGFAQGWLADTSTVLYALFIVLTWKYFGFHMILYLAGRQNIPQELLDAAATDGATPWQQFRHVTLPLLGPTIRISVFLSVIGVIQLFDMVWVLTTGGPVHESETMAVTMFNFGFRRFEVGYASAISMAMFMISLIFALFYQRLVMRRDIQGAMTVMGDQR